MKEKMSGGNSSGGGSGGVTTVHTGVVLKVHTNTI
jgi:hypothetical protein